ncbi:MAG: hypothetical protein FJ271_21680 [Planctomycetes bacterium]|nr:hypothetical protein [Planctomycetota bacterium]
MFRQRFALALLACLSVAGLARAQSVSLSEAPLKDAHFRIELDLDLTGEIKFQHEGKLTAMKQTAQARHEYVERALEAGPAGLVDRAARLYHSATATIHIDKDTSERKFPAEQLAIAQRVRDRVVSFAKEPFSREQLELTEHFDTLSLPGILPGKEVKVGETWKLTSAAVQALCDLDGLIDQDFTGTLDEVTGQTARFSVKGKASGITAGAAIKLAVQAKGEFDVGKKRIISLDWKQDDDREQGPVSPIMNAEARIKLKRTPLEAGDADKLNDLALLWAPLSGAPPKENTRLRYVDAQGRFELLHAREWHLIGRTERHVILRLMDRGDFVAQATISPWKKAEPGKHLSEDEFKEAMNNIPGWQADEVLDKGTCKDNDPHAGFWSCRLAVSGIWNGVKTVQYFYLVAGPEGDQTVFTFSMAPGQIQKLGTRDLDLLRGLSFPTK